MDHKGVMFPEIQPIPLQLPCYGIDCARSLPSFETDFGHVFLVSFPGKVFWLEEVDDGGIVCWDGGVEVVIEAVVVSGNGGNVVWLRGVGECVVVCESYRGLRKVLEVGV